MFSFLGAVRDVFDANTEEDKRKRLARGGQADYDADERASGRTPVKKTFSFLRDVVMADTSLQREGRKQLTETARSIPRSVVRAGGEAGFRLTGNKPSDYVYAEKDPVSRFLLGSEPVESFSKLGRDTGVRGAGGTAIGVGFTAADLIPGGGGKGKVGKELFEQLAKETSEEGIKKLLKKAGVEYTDDVARALKETTDPNIVGNILNKSLVPDMVPKPPAPAVGQDIIEATVPKVDNPAVAELQSTRQRLQRQWDNASSQTRPQIDQAIKSVDDEMRSLQEATVPRVEKPADPFDDIVGALNGQKAAKGQAPQKGLAATSQENKALLSEQRGKRFGASAQAGRTAEGSQGYFAELAELKGEYKKTTVGGMIDNIGPDEAEDLFSRTRASVQQVPDDVYKQAKLHPQSARLNTQTALRKVIFGEGGGVPTPSEIKLLRLVSPKLADDVVSKIPKHRQLFDWATKIIGSSRGAKSSLDFSMGGRQGLFVAARHPVIWAKANKNSVKYAKNEKYYLDEMAKRHGSEWGKLIDKYNPSVLTGGARHEEAYAGSDILTGEVAKKAGVGHLVAGSERAYTGGLTDIRYDLLEKNLKAFGDTAEEAEKTLGPKGVEGLIEAVSTLTGRGGKKGGWVDKHATTLQEALFSPRLWASRLQPFNPVYWKRIGPAGRKEAFQSLGSFAAVAGLVLSAAVAAGADVETDARSSDFLKIKVGDTRYDILGGFQQNLVFGWRQLTGEKKSSQTGKTVKFDRSLTDIITQKDDEEAGVETGPLVPNRLTVASDLVGNKAAPVVSSALKIIEGKDKSGNDVNPLTEIGQLFVPIGLQNAFNARKDGAGVVAKGTPEFVGIGSQTYGLDDINLTESQKKHTEKLSGPAKEAAEKFYRYQKTGPDRDDYSKRIKKLLQAGNEDEAVKLAKEYNQQYKDTFNDWREKYSQYRNDETLFKAYKSKLITDESFGRWIAGLEKEQ